MDAERQVEDLSNEEVLATFDTSEDPSKRGFDDETQLRMLAYELVRARARLAHYRTLYTSFVPAGKRYMIENLADGPSNGGVPAKLVFTDDEEQVADLEDNDEVVIWTEAALLEVLKQERTIHDFFTDLLDELRPDWPS